MGFFSNLFRGRDAPSNSTAGSGYGFFMGSTASGKRVNARSAMQMTAVYSCVRILSEAVAGLPLQFYRYNDNGGKEKAVDHPLYFLLHDEPNPEMTSFVFRETLMMHLLLWGNAYSQIIRNGKGEIVALYPLMPDRIMDQSLRNCFSEGCLWYLLHLLSVSTLYYFILIVIPKYSKCLFIRIQNGYIFNRCSLL